MNSKLLTNMKIELKQDVLHLIKRINDLASSFNINKKIILLKNINSEIQSTNFWNDKRKAVLLEKQRIKLFNELENYNKIKKGTLDCYELLKIIKEEEFDLKDIKQEIDNYKKLLKNIEIGTMLFKSNDYNNSILCINAGSGGIDSQDFSNILFRMYTRYAELRNYIVKVIDIQYGEECGIKSVTILVLGKYSYGYLKSEIGVHRLVRISPFDSSSRRHTSFASVWVLPYITDNNVISIKSSDIRIDTFRACGPGGQHVNKTNSAVRVTHIPTKIIVTCQAERSQIKNKFVAMKLLKAKILNLQKQEKLKAKKAIEKKKLEASFGSQIRNYILSPYRLVKDLRSGYEACNVDSVFNGRIQPFIEAYLLYLKE